MSEIQKNRDRITSLTEKRNEYSRKIQTDYSKMAGCSDANPLMTLKSRTDRYAEKVDEIMTSIQRSVLVVQVFQKEVEYSTLGIQVLDIIRQRVENERKNCDFSSLGFLSRVYEDSQEEKLRGVVTATWWNRYNKERIKALEKKPEIKRLETEIGEYYKQIQQIDNQLVAALANHLLELKDRKPMPDIEQLRNTARRLTSLRKF